MPDPKKKIIAPNVEKYKGKDPLKEGYKELAKVENKTYYDKEAEKAISGGTPGADWEKKIQQMAASGVSPEELVKAGHISPSQIEKFRPFYKQVYTETPPLTAPKTTVIDPAIGNRNNMKLLPKGSAGQLWDTYEVPDLNGQVNQSKQVQVYNGKVLDNNKLLQTGDPNLSMTDEAFQGIRDANVRSDAQGATNLPTSVNGVPVTGNALTDPLLMKPKGDKAGTVLSSTSGGFKHGGLIKKIRKYADGGEIDPSEFQNLKGDSQLQTSLGSTALNAAIPGAGTAYGAIAGAKDAMTGEMSQIDPATGKYVNRGKAQNAGLINGVWNMSGAGMLKTAIDPNKTIGEKALSIGTYGISDLIKNRNNVNKMETDNVALVDNAKKTAQQKELAQTSLSQQLTDRSQGLRNGGKIIGKGNGTSDSITAKIKEDSFVVPAKNAAKAELVRKVVLKAPTTKANLNQGSGAKVKLSNGEHLFTPKEVEKIENKLGDDVLDKLAPNSAKAEDKIEGEVNEVELKDGGSLADALKEGNKKTSTKKAPTYTSKKSVAKISPDYLDQITSTIDTPQGDREAVLDESNVPLPSNQSPMTSAPKSNTGGLAGKFSAGDVSKALEMGIPLAQIGFGLSQLRKQGKRPVGEIDKDYLASIDAARTGLQVANVNAKYGFTPEENALINQENQNLTNAQRYTARNLGGGAGNSYNMERNAINNSFGRGLKAKVENANLKLQKQGIASDKQAYLDNLIANKAGMSRQLFNDKMNAFNTNQQAGAGLLSSGIKNALGASRYNAELDAMKNTANIENSWMNNLPK
jgi:hypothetical protein